VRTDATWAAVYHRLPAWVRVRLDRLLGSDFVRKVAETFLARIALVAIGLITSVMIARALGPEGRGLQATLAAVVAIGAQLGNFGLHSANTYYVARDKSLLPVLLGNTLLLSLVSGALVALAGWLVLTIRPSLAPLPSGLLALAFVTVPLSLAYMLLQNLLLGIGEVRAFNLIEVASRLAMIVLLAALVVARSVSVAAIAVLGIVLAIAGVAAVIVRLRPHISCRIRVSLVLMREHFVYGFRAYIGALFAFTVLRADIVIAKLLLGAEATGQYSIAVSMADLVYMLPVAAGTIAFPRLTATQDPAERWAKALSVTKYIGLVMVALAVLAALLVRPAVELLYGDAFLPSVPAFLWLLPGVVMLGVNTILMNYFASIGNPSVVIWSPAVASGLNIALNVILMPRIGISGAAIASSVAYGLMLLMSSTYVIKDGSTRRSA